MGDGTEISWTDATWNPITGCMVKSPGCIHCYAMRLAATRLKHHPSRKGLARITKAGPVWTGEVRFNEQWLDQPLRWREPRDIFVCAHADLFYEKVPDAWIDRIFAVMVLARQHRLQVLTKRPDRAAQYLSGGRELYQRVLNAARPLRDWRPELGDIPIDDPAAGDFHRNIWIGTSVERQREADERRLHLAAIAALGFNTWVSYEPALGPVDWDGWQFIRWMVSGGESGPDARPSHPDWHRDTRDWCVQHSIPFHFKQWGSWKVCELAGPHSSREHVWPDGVGMLPVGKKAAGAMLDGREWREMPHA